MPIFKFDDEKLNWQFKDSDPPIFEHKLSFHYVHVRIVAY
jgi:hypothetical protein